MSLKVAARLKELRIHLCQSSKQSAGVREFIQQHYVPIKQANPTFPILIRECAGVQPRVWARYEKGQEKSSPLTDMTSQEVLDEVKKLMA